MKQTIIPVALILLTLAACAPATPPLAPQSQQYRHVTPSRPTNDRVRPQRRVPNESVPNATNDTSTNDTSSDDTDHQFTRTEDRFLSTHDSYTAAYELGISKEKIDKRRNEMDRPKN